MIKYSIFMNILGGHMRKVLKNFGFERGSGILLPISALPSSYGIGSFGKEAYSFADFLAETGTRCWQILPLNPTSYGDSPYQSPASMAGNPYFIDLEILNAKGLITKEDLKDNKCDEREINYGWLFNTRYPLLRKAYRAFSEHGGEKNAEYKKFKDNNGSWLSDYSLFMALKASHGFAEWVSWEDEYRDISSARKHLRDFSEECGFWEWVQFEFDAQWQKLRTYAHEKGLVIIGDMPIYVAHDSMDVWRDPEEFLLDENYMPTLVAGCPPDGFSPDGQLWGNPIYNWERMKDDGFTWWCRRIGEAFRLYDILRIDHFRGFAGYYSIPASHDTARDGSWNSAPGIELFNRVSESFPEARIIAEDLGFITDDVRDLLEHTGFPGMKMLQFAFYDEDNEYLPRMYKTDNCVVYTGSHDSDCAHTFRLGLTGEAKKRFLKECPHRPKQCRTHDLIEYALGSRANLAVIPLQDYMRMKNPEGRINTPGKAYGNWVFRLKKSYNTETLRNTIKEMNLRSGRIQ